VLLNGLETSNGLANASPRINDDVGIDEGEVAHCPHSRARKVLTQAVLLRMSFRLRQMPMKASFDRCVILDGRERAGV
jgi:hypothetical protein